MWGAARGVAILYVALVSVAATRHEPATAHGRSVVSRARSTTGDVRISVITVEYSDVGYGRRTIRPLDLFPVRLTDASGRRQDVVTDSLGVAMFRRVPRGIAIADRADRIQSDDPYDPYGCRPETLVVWPGRTTSDTLQLIYRQKRLYH
jgi:hypothetical protein